MSLESDTPGPELYQGDRDAYENGLESAAPWAMALADVEFGHRRPDTLIGTGISYDPTIEQHTLVLDELMDGNTAIQFTQTIAKIAANP